MDTSGLPLPKGEPRKLAKAREDRRERRIIARNRKTVAGRDGYCRMADAPREVFGACGGASQWAHVGESRRWKTVGRDPEVRHATSVTLMLCDNHHDKYDAHEFEIEPVTEAAGTNGRILVVKDDFVYAEDW